MAMILNRLAYDHARKLIANRQCVLDKREDWTDHRPARTAENRFIQEHGYAEYGRWHLGIDDEIKEKTKARYKFPYGDFVMVHRCALQAAELRAGQTRHQDIELAAAHLYGMLDELELEHAAGVHAS